MTDPGNNASPTNGMEQVRWIELASAADPRGVLTIVDDRSLPFPIRRFFYLHNVPGSAERGGHAHRGTQQFVIPVAGSFKMDLTDGRSTETYQLADPRRGVFIPAMIWDRLYEFSPGAVCLVVADTLYDPADYIRDWAEFRRIAGA